jgi:DNA repair ATPase RecN
VENEGRQSWILIAIAALGLALGVIALVVAFDAKSASDDAASQKSVDEVSTELSNLVDRLGIAEASLTGEQQALQGKAKRALKQSRSAVTNLSDRVDKLERETASLNKSVEQTASLSKQVGSLQTQVNQLNSRVTAVNKRVANLSRGNTHSGGQSADQHP